MIPAARNHENSYYPQEDVGFMRVNRNQVHPLSSLPSLNFWSFRAPDLWASTHWRRFQCCGTDNSLLKRGNDKRALHFHRSPPQNYPNFCICLLSFISIFIITIPSNKPSHSITMILPLHPLLLPKNSDRPPSLHNSFFSKTCYFSVQDVWHVLQQTICVCQSMFYIF